ncbi:MAG: SDR family oxidoreductase, partial [Proteobacteria bacterium]|nr:SDR family oxidoreductase [Pseudomonadota bacterium]
RLIVGSVPPTQTAVATGLNNVVRTVGGVMAAIADQDEAAWDQVINVNLKGVWLCMKHQIRQFKAQGGGGSIVNTASAFGLLGSKGGSAYSASKHGVVGLTASAALDEAEHQIRINAVCPGVIRTPMAERYAKQLDDPNKPLARTPLKRWGEPSEIAEAALWLLSDRASFVTGVAMPVDGGMLAG